MRDTGSSSFSFENTEPEILNEWLQNVRGAIIGGQAIDTYYHKPVVLALIALTQLIRCTEEHLGKFQ